MVFADKSRRNVNDKQGTQNLNLKGKFHSRQLHREAYGSQIQNLKLREEQIEEICIYRTILWKNKFIIASRKGQLVVLIT